MFEPGSIFGGYRIERVLGRGGMGVVYEATQLSLERTVALKVLTPELSGDDAFRERFRREGLIQARIDHPHIVTVHEAGSLDGHLFLAMRLVHGATLKDVVRDGELDPARLLRILTPVADALDVAHEEGLIHRDVKPQNILVGRRDHAFLADFGLTKGPGERTLTKTGHFVGTLDYVSPEQVHGRPASPSSDVYALAAVLFESLTGRVPFPRETDVAVLFAHANDDPPSVCELLPWAPPEIDAVIARGMAKEPEERPSSATELLAAAADALQGVVGAPGPPPGTVGRASDKQVTPLPGSTVDRDLPPLPPEEEPPSGDAALPGTVGGLVAQATIAPSATPASVPVAEEPVTEESEPESAPAPSRRGLVRIAALVVLAALALVAGLALGGGSEPEPTASPGPALATSGARLALPSGWQRLADPPTLPGLELTTPAAASTDGGATRLVTGLAPGADGPDLLPDELVARVEGEVPKPTTVRTGSSEALRYEGLELEGVSSPVTLLLVPTTKGTVAVGCLADASGACDPALGDLRVSDAVELGPDAAYARRLSTVLRKLSRDRARLGSELRSAKTPDGQASRAGDLAEAHADALRSVPRRTGNPLVEPANADLRRALRELDEAYTSLASAARRNSDARYRRARAAAASGDRDLRAALADLRAAGYR